MPVATVSSVVTPDYAPRAAKRGHRIPENDRVRYLAIAVRFDRLTTKSEDADACWEWRGTHDAKGYGHFSVGGKNNHKSVRAHRVAYELANGPIPDGRHILHTCDNPGCVNPQHLRADTNQQNQHEAWARDRKRNVRKLSPEQVLEIRASDLPQSVLSRHYGVCQGEISRVRNGSRGNGILLMMEA